MIFCQAKAKLAKSVVGLPNNLPFFHFHDLLTWPLAQNIAGSVLDSIFRMGTPAVMVNVTNREQMSNSNNLLLFEV